VPEGVLLFAALNDDCLLPHLGHLFLGDLQLHLRCHLPTTGHSERAGSCHMNIKLVIFLSGRVKGQYIIEGLSSGFMFLRRRMGIILLDFSLDKHKARSVKVSFGVARVSSLAIAYIMSKLFVRIKIPSYLC